MARDPWDFKSYYNRSSVSAVQGSGTVLSYESSVPGMNTASVHNIDVMFLTKATRSARIPKVQGCPELKNEPSLATIAKSCIP